MTSHITTCCKLAALLSLVAALALSACGDDPADPGRLQYRGKPLRLDPECERLSCRLFGRCSFDPLYKRCRAHQGDCAQSETCHINGSCEATSRGVCEVTNEAFCRQSTSCATEGQCRLGNGRCVAVPGWAASPSCADSMACFTHGKCAGSYPSCRTTPAGCANSQRCASDGRCTHAGGESCVATSVAECEASDGCLDEGLCALDTTTRSCTLGTDEDCRASWGCRDHGACVAAEEACVVGTSADCAASYGCRDSGRCVKKDHPDGGGRPPICQAGD
jgi:hypothetical protein